MTDLYKYRIWCNTESISVETWSESEPTTCPNNNEHEIDSDKTIVIDMVLDQPLRDSFGKQIVRADSRPIEYQTMFTMRGDSDTVIGGGQKLFWDFSNDDDILDSTCVLEVGFKVKRIKVSFVDHIYIKEGTVYFFDALKLSHIEFSVVCPSGQYYLDRNGNPQLSSEDVKVVSYVNSHFFSGSCPMGDELNTESCSENPIPSNYELWIEICVPNSDNSSYGHGELEVYRVRSILLPNEEV